MFALHQDAQLQLQQKNNQSQYRKPDCYLRATQLSAGYKGCPPKEG
jgi:hypothetical protein